MKYSEHYNMNKPDNADNYNVSHWNTNTDIIDRELFNETSGRINADNNLDTKIDNEISAREEAIRQAMNLANATNVLAIENGGTNANTKIDAIRNLIESVPVIAPDTNDNVLLQYGVKGIKKTSIYDFANLIYILTRVQIDTVVKTGTIHEYGGDIAPDGYLLCDGREISRTEYAALFHVIGIKFGVGDGINTFNIPDFRGRVPEGATTAVGTTHASGLPALPVINNCESHTHTATGIANENGQHSHGYTGRNEYYGAGQGYWGQWYQERTWWTQEAGKHTHTLSITVENSGIHNHTYAESNIYGKSDKVQAPSVEINYIIKY